MEQVSVFFAWYVANLSSHNILIKILSPFFAIFFTVEIVLTPFMLYYLYRTARKNRIVLKRKKRKFFFKKNELTA